MKTLAIVCLMLVAVSYAQDDGAYAPVEGEEYDTVKQQQAAEKEEQQAAEKEKIERQDMKDADAPKGTFVYNGRYSDECDVDGLYYRDAVSFVICSGKTAYVQPCAPGSANRDLSFFSVREPYHTNSFCSVNNNGRRPYYRDYPPRGFYRGFRDYYQ